MKPAVPGTLRYRLLLWCAQQWMNIEWRRRPESVQRMPIEAQQQWLYERACNKFNVTTKDG